MDVMNEQWEFIRLKDETYYFESKNLKLDFSLTFMNSRIEQITFDIKAYTSFSLYRNKAEEFRLHFLSLFPELIL